MEADTIPFFSAANRAEDRGVWGDWDTNAEAEFDKSSAQDAMLREGALTSLKNSIGLLETLRTVRVRENEKNAVGELLRWDGPARPRKSSSSSSRARGSRSETADAGRCPAVARSLSKRSDRFHHPALGYLSFPALDRVGCAWRTRLRRGLHTMSIIQLVHLYFWSTPWRSSGPCRKRRTS